MCPFSPTKSPEIPATRIKKKAGHSAGRSVSGVQKRSAQRRALCPSRTFLRQDCLHLQNANLSRRGQCARRERNDPLAFTGSPQIHALQASRLERLPWNFSSVRSKQLQLSARGRFVACVKISLNVEKKTHTDSELKSGRYVMENNRLYASWKTCIDSTYCLNRDEIWRHSARPDWKKRNRVVSWTFERTLEKFRQNKSSYFRKDSINKSSRLSKIESSPILKTI